MEIVEREMMTVKERRETLGSQMVEMNQRMKGLETSVKTIKGYLRDLRESAIDKGKILVG